MEAGLEMLKNMDPLLSPELLYVLAAMGHGDEVAVVDANFPADSVARRTGLWPAGYIRRASPCPRSSAPCYPVLPLDEFVDQPVRRMAVDGAPGESTRRPARGSSRRRYFRRPVMAHGGPRALRLLRSGS